MSFKLLRKCVFIGFILGKLLPTEAVVTGMDKLIKEIVCKFGKIVFIMSFEASSFNCNFMLYLGFLIMNCWWIFHSEHISEEITASLIVGSLSDDSCRSLFSIMCQECSNGFISTLRQIRRVNAWHFPGIKDAHC